MRTPPCNCGNAGRAIAFCQPSMRGCGAYPDVRMSRALCAGCESCQVTDDVGPQTKLCMGIKRFGSDSASHRTAFGATLYSMEVVDVVNVKAFRLPSCGVSCCDPDDIKAQNPFDLVSVLLR